MTLTEPWITNTAGWKAVKEAKMMLQGGAVQEASYDPPLLKGVVVAGGRRMTSGLRITGPTDVENLCTCRVARHTGQICGHSVAVALAVIHGMPAQQEQSAPKQSNESKAEAPAKPSKSQKSGGVRVVFNERMLQLWERGRIPVHFEEADEGAPIWPWLESVGITSLPTHGVLDPMQASQLIVMLNGNPEVRLGERPMEVSQTLAARLKVRLKRQGTQFTLEADSIIDGKDQVILEAGESGWVYFPTRCMIQRLRPAPQGFERDYAHLLNQARGELSAPLRLGAGKLFAILDALEDCLEMRSDDGALRVETATPLFSMRLEGSLNALSGFALVSYEGGPEFALGKEPPSDAFPIFEETSGHFLARAQRMEQQALQWLEDMGFSEPDSSGQMHLRGEADIYRFYATHLPKLQKHWTVELGERFQHVTRDLEVVRPTWTPSGNDPNWLTFAVDYRSPGGVELSPQEVRRLLNTGQTKHALPNGKTVALDLAACEETDEVLYDVQPEQEGGLYRANPAQRGYLALALGGENLADETPVSLEPLNELREILRSYQADGIRWMTARLRGAAQSCLLADEMGLGKTLQSLATAELLLQNQEENGPCQVLIVCPASLLTNWKREAERFLPDRQARILHGTDRWENREAIEEADFLITSYALMVRDIDPLREREFVALILDEASAIKNPDTKNAKAARRLQAKHRIALSGTPVENSVRELWSIFEFLTPGYLGTRTEFKERYENPVASGAAPRPVLDRLRKRIQPLMLRRLKQTVARDLPPKIEQVRYCDLQPKQAALYEAILRESRKKIDDALSAKADGQARMTILTALLRLRQVCCDPRLLNLEDSQKAPGSGKLELFQELLAEVRAGDHKMLVFSQFTSMLKLMRETLEEEGMEYCYLDGASRDRAQQVDRFQNSGPELPIFLISLKAGGYGLNLTAADSVVHYDPWWNPAVEAQATDRAHRLGQTNPVNVYKLITSGTVEERILALQRKKRSVIDAAMDEGEPMMQGLSTEELREVIA